MKYSAMALATAASLVLSGCTVVDRLASSFPVQFTPDKTLIPSAQASQRLTQAQADALVQHLANAINRQDEEALRPYLPDSKRDRAMIEVAFADYNVQFQGKPITGIQLEQAIDGGLWMQQPAQDFYYRLSNEDGVSVRIRLDQERGHVWLVDGFFRYSYLAKQKIERLIRAIQKNDPTDRADYATYRAAFDPETLKYGFDGLDARGFFKYTLYGSKAGKPVEHSIIVILGDNDVGFEDSFLPKSLP